MAVVGHLHKIAFGGTLAQTETWSCGFHFLNASTAVDQPEVLESAIEQWMARAESIFSSYASLNWIKLNEIDPLTGDYVDTANSNTHFVTTVISGGTQGGAPDITVANSTVTALARGYGSKGRWYPPNAIQSGSLSADGRLASSIALAAAVSGAQLLTDINGALDGSLVVFSSVGQVAQEITGVRTGRVIDHQGRRRKNLLEDYQFAPIS